MATLRSPFLAAALLVVALVPMACGTRVGGSSHSGIAPTSTPSPASSTAAPTTTTEDPAAAKAEITAAWERFFDHQTSLADREALLENGAQYDQALKAQAQNPLMAQASAKVGAVALTGPTSATVTYTVFLNGQPALPDATGTAVRQDGVWKVSGQSFCSLIGLTQQGAVPGCS